jgi:hypothetical protein
MRILKLLFGLVISFNSLSQSLFVGNHLIEPYIGFPNVTKYIPQNCFINFTNYNNFESLHKYLTSLDENDYLKYIFNIKKFYRSNKSNVFKNDLFLKTLKKHLIKDLRLLNKSKLVF